MNHEVSDADIIAAFEAYIEHGRNKTHAAKSLGLSRSTFKGRLDIAARKGLLLDQPPAMPGFEISKVTDGPAGKTVQQKQEHGKEFELPEGHFLKGVSALVDASGRTIIEWRKTAIDQQSQLERIKTAAEEFSKRIPSARPKRIRQLNRNSDLLNQYTVTDMHFGALAWSEETGDSDYDLKIAEDLWNDWFSAAISMAPKAQTALFAQLGDLLHHDSMVSITPNSGNVLDADSRLQKMIRIAIRCLKRSISMLLDKYENVHIVMADANHDPTAGAWLREWLASYFEDESRVSVDNSAMTYYCYEHGMTSLFFHHGHKRSPDKKLDSVFAGQFRDVFGRTKYSYAHTGHKHADELRSTNLMKVEQHETLAAPDAYAASGGWLSGRSAKVITYSKRFGEVGRISLSPEMVAGAGD